MSFSSGLMLGGVGSSTKVSLPQCLESIFVFDACGNGIVPGGNK